MKPAELETELLEEILFNVPEMIEDLKASDLKGNAICYPYFIDCIYSVIFSIPDLKLIRVEWFEDGEICYKNLQ
jgi:hypothetical protein